MDDDGFLEFTFNLDKITTAILGEYLQWKHNIKETVVVMAWDKQCTYLMI